MKRQRKSGLSPYNGVQRREDGMTVFASNDEGKCRSFVRSGISTNDALRDICGRIDALGPDWKIDCISTPTTIIRDMNGHREAVQPSVKSRSASSEGGVSEVTFPEDSYLGRIGRADLFRGKK